MASTISEFESDPRIANYARLTGRRVSLADAESLITQPARALWGWWQSASRTRPAGGDAGRRNCVARSAFDVVDHAGIAPHLFLIERIDRGFRLRLAGEAFEQMFLRRKGHEWINDERLVDSPQSLGGAFAGYFDFVAETGLPFRSFGRLKGRSDWFAFESLLCPLQHRGGDQLIGVVAKVSEAQAGG
jgi:hypothetical protein